MIHRLIMAPKVSVEFKDLATRFRQLHQTEEEEMKIEDIQKMSYSDLKDHRMDFGTAKKGMKFEEVVKDVQYITWFTGTYKNSQKATHYRLLHFTKLHVEQLERAKTLKPKAKAKSGAYPTTKMDLPEIPGLRPGGHGGTGMFMGTSGSPGSQPHGAGDHGDAGPHGPDGECAATSTSSPEPQGEVTEDSPVERCDPSSAFEECLKTLAFMSDRLPEVIDADFVLDFH